VLCLAGRVYAQPPKLSQFTLPDFERNELDFNLASSNSMLKENAENQNNALFRDYKNLNSAHGGTLNFRHYRNSDKYQRFFEIGLNGAYPGKADSETRDTASIKYYNSKEFSYGISISSVNRVYKQAKWYTEINPFMSFQNSGFESEEEVRLNDPIKDYKDYHSIESNYFNTGIEFRLGKGRVERVEDLRQLMYILDDLKNAGKLTRDAGWEETILIAQQLSAVKNRRFLDARLRLREELQLVDSILHASNLLTQSDAHTGAIINDFWSMAPNPLREAGSRFSIGIKPNYLKDKSYNAIMHALIGNGPITYSQRFVGKNYEIKALNAIVNMRYENYKPLNLYWQQDFTLNTDLDMLKDRTTPYRRNNWVMLLTLNGEYRMNYYPNSRTTIGGYGKAVYQKGRGLEPFGAENATADYQYLGLESGLSSTYYFSPHLSANVLAGAGYYKTYNTFVFYQSTPFSDNLIRNVYFNFGFLYKFF
jgi:hypothetical protein